MSRNKLAGLLRFVPTREVGRNEKHRISSCVELEVSGKWRWNVTVPLYPEKPASLSCLCIAGGTTSTRAAARHHARKAVQSWIAKGKPV